MITYGPMLRNAMEAAERLSEKGIEASVLRLMSLAPLPMKEMVKYLPVNGKVVVVEEVSGHCGIGHELACGLQSLRPDCRTVTLDLGENYVCHGHIDTLYARYGLSPEAIEAFVMEALRCEN